MAFIRKLTGSKKPSALMPGRCPSRLEDNISQKPQERGAYEPIGLDQDPRPLKLWCFLVPRASAVLEWASESTQEKSRKRNKKEKAKRPGEL